MKITQKQKEEIFKKSKAGKSNEDLADEYGVAVITIKKTLYEQQRMSSKDLEKDQSVLTQLKKSSIDNGGRKTMTLKEENRILKIMYADLAIKFWKGEYPDLEII